MGCCFSSTTTSRNKSQNLTDPTNRCLSPPKPPDHHQQQPPPPPPSQPTKPQLEEETVKEVVLSETPVPPPKPIISQQTLTPISKPNTEQQDPRTNQPPPPPPPSQEPPQPESEAVSEYSDVCSFSGSVSTATTVTEKRENEVTSRDHTRDNNSSSYAYNNNIRRLHGRSNNGSSPVKPGLQRKRPYVAAGGEKRGRGVGSGGFPPAQRSAPSPERSGKVGMGVRGRGLVQGKYGGERADGGVRRVSGEVSCRRRSSSPATGRDGGAGRGSVGRSPGKRTGSAGSRSRDLSEENTSTSNTEVDAKKDLSLGSESEEKKKTVEDNGGVSENGNESIDNPLVSLECFIFL